MNVSVVITTKNEEKSIKKLLNSLLNQTLMPKEIIIVDSKSTDNTVKVINKFKKKFKNKGTKLKIIIKECSIGEGRMLGVKYAKCKLIAFTDAGCIADKNWLRSLVHAYVTYKVPIIGGIFLPAPSKSKIEMAIRYSVIPSVTKQLKGVPTMKNVIIEKKVFSKVKFRKDLKTAEDALFMYEAKKKGFNWIKIKESIVYWEVRNNLKKLFKQFYNYGKGARRSNLYLKFFYQPTNMDARNCFLAINILILYFIILLLSLLFSKFVFYLSIFLPLFYILLSSIKKAIYWKDTKLAPYLFVCEIVKRSGYYLGFFNFFSKKE